MVGKIAVCQHGVPGLVTGSKMVRGKVSRRLYTGVSLRDGRPWQSVNPRRVVGTIDELLATIDSTQGFVNEMVARGLPIDPYELIEEVLDVEAEADVQD